MDMSMNVLQTARRFINTYPMKKTNTLTMIAPFKPRRGATSPIGPLALGGLNTR